MSQQGCVLTEGSQNNVVNYVFTMELFDSTSTSSSTISNNTTSTGGSSCSSSSLECSGNDLPGSGLSSPLTLPCAHSCKLSPPLKLNSPNSKPSSSPSSLRKVDHDHRSVKRSMGLMKLRRQGSHPPAAPASRSRNKSCHGSINQAAAARELMASLERLSLKEKTMSTNEERVTEAKRTLLGGDHSEESVDAAASCRNGMKVDLPLTAKIAAAMDAEGLIGVQEELSLQCSKMYKSPVLRSFSDQYSYPSSFKTCKSRKPRRPAAASGDYEMRVGAARKMHSTLSKGHSRWIILRRLRYSRAMLGKIWRNLKRIFSSSSRKTFQKELLEVNT